MDEDDFSPPSPHPPSPALPLPSPSPPFFPSLSFFFSKSDTAERTIRKSNYKSMPRKTKKHDLCLNKLYQIFVLFYLFVLPISIFVPLALTCYLQFLCLISDYQSSFSCFSSSSSTHSSSSSSTPPPRSPPLFPPRNQIQPTDDSIVELQIYAL